MAYGNAERMWNLQEYIKEYDKLKSSHDGLVNLLLETRLFLTIVKNATNDATIINTHQKMIRKITKALALAKE